MKTEMARVVVIGTSCVGKTTFAQVARTHFELSLMLSSMPSIGNRTGSRGRLKSSAR